MKLRNKKTGEILRVEFLNNYQTDDGTEIGFRDSNSLDVYSYNSLAELNAEWEDYEEPKEVWYIDFQGMVRSASKEENDWFKENEIGNCFETKEEAEKAVEKLKAWKRLRDKGFKFTGINEQYVWVFEEPYRDGGRKINFNKSEDDEWLKENWNDLHLLFGDEE